MPDSARARESLTDRNHPIYAAIYTVLARQGERTVVGKLRTSTLGPARGRLLVVGLGPGYELEHLPPSVDSVVALEPSATMLRKAQPRVHLLRQRLPLLTLRGIAERLPLRDASIDTVLCAFVLCSVVDVQQCLHEFRRVLRPDGQLLLLEHVGAPPGTRTRRSQELLERVWPRLAAGCHLTRDLTAEVVAAGFDAEDVHDLRLPAIPICAASVSGAARLHRTSGP
jgi:ubiquinone/menaquinone biosynthesis C-methylase UbiE